MKTMRAIKLTVFLGGFLVSLSQIPRMMEMIEGVNSGNPLSGLSGFAGADKAFDLIGDLQQQGITPTEGEQDVALRVFSPDGGELTPEQQAELMAAAERMRPRIVRRENPESTPDENNPNAPLIPGVSASGIQANPSLLPGLDSTILKQLESVQQAEELVKQLTKVGDDK